MGYVIFDSLTNAADYTAEIERVQGIPREGTDRWGDPIKCAYADLWAVIASTGYVVPIPPTAVDTMPLLPENWWTK